MRQMLSIFIICVLFVFGIRPGFGAVSAQADTETPVVSPALPLVDVESAGEQVIGVINGVVTGGVNAAWFAPIVALLVGLLKQVPALYKADPDDPSGVSAPTLSFAVSSVIWVVAAIVTRVGVVAQFNSFMDLIVQSAPYIFGFLATLGIAPAVHEYAATVKAPIIGTKRSPEQAVLEAIPASALASYQPVVTSVAAEIDESALRNVIGEELDARMNAYFKASGLADFNWTPKDNQAAG